MEIYSYAKRSLKYYKCITHDHHKIGHIAMVFPFVDLTGFTQGRIFYHGNLLYWGTTTKTLNTLLLFFHNFSLENNALYNCSLRNSLISPGRKPSKCKPSIR